MAAAHRAILRMADGTARHSFTRWLLVVPVPGRGALEALGPQ